MPCGTVAFRVDVRKLELMALVLLFGCRDRPLAIVPLDDERAPIEAERASAADAAPDARSVLEGSVPGASFDDATVLARVTLDDGGGPTLASIAVYADASTSCGELAWGEWHGSAEIQPLAGGWSAGARMAADVRFHPHVEGATVRGRLFARSADGEGSVRGGFEARVCIDWRRAMDSFARRRGHIDRRCASSSP